MADEKNSKTEPVVEQTERSSKQQAKENDHVARTPQGPNPASSAGLTGHTTEAEVVEADGKVVAVHETTVVTDPNASNAVQIPDHPGVDARSENPLGDHGEPTPEEAFASGNASDSGKKS
jgi:hypothetical protein